MKKAMNNRLSKLLFLPLFIFAMFTSCQNEVTEITDPNEQQVLVANSQLANLMQYTSQKDGSIDNIIDYANCISINLPVTVIVNGLEITIDSEEDLAVIEAIFDEFSDDDDIIEIIFPITIILNDHSEVVINNYDELEAFIEECNGENEEDDDIECIDFQYPITISVYDANFDVIDTITINSDEELYHFIDELEGGLLASINFPVTMILADGSELVVNNNAELQAAIEAAEDECDEDDDNDWNDDDNIDITVGELEELLVNCTWKVDDLEVNDQDFGDQYEGYVFDFKADGTVVATDPNSGTREGTWELFETDAGIKLNLQMANLTDFSNEMWLLHEIEDYDHEFEIEFRQGINELSFEKYECENDVADCTEEQVDGYLMECLWRAGFNGDNNFAEYEFYFNANEELVVQHSVNDEEIVGTWTTVLGDDGNVIIGIDLPESLSDFSGEWSVYECSEGRIKIVNGDLYIVFERECPNDQTPNDLHEIVTVGEWLVALYNDSGVDETADYNGYTVVFNTDGTAVATNNTSTLNGTWSGTLNNGQLKMLLDFGTEVPFNEFNDDWDVFELAANRFELRDVSGGNGTLDKLVFEKL